MVSMEVNPEAPYDEVYNDKCTPALCEHLPKLAIAARPARSSVEGP